MVYLLDTNTCVECLRDRNAGVVAKFRSSRPSELRLCSVVLGELFYGAYKSPQPAANLALVQKFAAPLTSLPFDDQAADIYGQIRNDLEQRGVPIGPNDGLIAAIAVSNGLTLVTHNTAEFSRVNGLRVDDWYT